MTPISKRRIYGYFTHQRKWLNPLVLTCCALIGVSILNLIGVSKDHFNRWCSCYPLLRFSEIQTRERECIGAFDSNLIINKTIHHNLDILSENVYFSWQSKGQSNGTLFAGNNRFVELFRLMERCFSMRGVQDNYRGVYISNSPRETPIVFNGKSNLVTYRFLRFADSKTSAIRNNDLLFHEIGLASNRSEREIKNDALQYAYQNQKPCIVTDFSLGVCILLGVEVFFFGFGGDLLLDSEFFCLAPIFLDSELSVFMQRLRAQGVAGELASRRATCLWVID
jgi:hypothetical protein